MDIQGKLDQLTPKQRSYVTFRIVQDNDAPAYRRAGYSRDAWYRLPEERRHLMTECAIELSRETATQAVELIANERLDAARRIIMLAKTAKSETVKLKANNDILGLGGMVIQKQVDVTSAGESFSWAGMMVEDDPDSDAS